MTRSRIALLLALCLVSGPALAADGDAEVKITIADSTANEMMAQAYKANVGKKNETANGYEKVEQLGEDIIRESFKKDGQMGSLTSLVNGRTTVEIRTTGLPASEMRVWLERIDRNSIAAAKPEEETGVIAQGDLVKALPKSPDGWQGGRPEEVTSSAMGFTLSQAMATYTKKK